jgi:hypothetical protein
MNMALVRRIAFTGCMMLFLTGCRGLLPSAKVTTESPWKTFTEAKTAFEKIEPGRTTSEELKTLGFDINASPNLKILNYLDIAATVQSIRIEDLDAGLQQCIRARNDCHAYVFEPKMTRSRRIVNFWLDLFNFQRKSHDTGWQFKALLVLVNDHVSYKLWSGSPQIDEYRDQRNPLGPLQDAGGLLLNIR